MPIVTIQVTREGTRRGFQSLTATEKAALIKAAVCWICLTDPLKMIFVVAVWGSGYSSDQRTSDTFWIFNVRHYLTCRGKLPMSVDRGKADLALGYSRSPV